MVRQPENRKTRFQAASFIAPPAPTTHCRDRCRRIADNAAGNACTQSTATSCRTNQNARAHRPRRGILLASCPISDRLPCLHRAKCLVIRRFQDGTACAANATRCLFARAVYLHARFKLGALRAVYAFAGKNRHGRLLEKWFSGCPSIHIHRHALRRRILTPVIAFKRNLPCGFVIRQFARGASVLRQNLRQGGAALRGGQRI